MKIKISLSLFFTCCIGILQGQEFEIDTLKYNGSDDNRIILSILSDGYVEDELGKYFNDAGVMVGELFNTTPFKEYEDFFNVYAIRVPSNESGADHPGTATDVTEPVFAVVDVDNAFGSTFDFSNIHRLVVPTKSSEILTVLANNTPAFDQSFVLVNSDEYGGSGGQFATATTDQSSGEIAIHEIGHSFGNLSDEYWAGNNFARETNNMTQESNPELVKWKDWIGVKDVDIYPHGTSGIQADWNRPHQNCKMRILGVPFCAVCTEAFIDKIYNLVDPVESFLPEEQEIDLTANSLFSVQLVNSNMDGLKQIWLSNEDTLSVNQNMVELDPSTLPAGNSQVHYHLYDETELSRSYWPERGYFWSTSWNVNRGNTTSISHHSNLVKFSYKIYPNPSQDQIMVEYDNSKSAIEKLNIQWIGLNGQSLHQDEQYLTAAKGNMVLIKPTTNSAIQLLKLHDLKTGWSKSILLNR